MRILLITDNHAPTGGAEHYFFELKNRLKKIPGMEVHSLGFGPAAFNDHDSTVLKKVNSKWRRLIWQLIPHPLMTFKLRREIKKIQPDVIHLHNIRQYTISLLHAIKPYPVVQTVHDYSVICPSGQNLHQDLQACTNGFRLTCFWQHRLQHHPLVYCGLLLAFLHKRRLLKKTVKKFFAPSPLLADYLQRNKFKDAMIIAPFKNSVKEPSFHAINPHHFLFAGSLGRHKGVYVLLEEFALAHLQNNSLSLTIAGIGPEEKQLRARIHELDLEKNIHFIGWQENLEQEYAKCAAVIFPSLGLETFGLVMTEAMSHSRPVIGSNRGTPPWVIDDEQTGFIFDPLKRGNLAEKILTLGGNTDLITQLGMKGEEKLRTFIDNEVELGKMVAAYQKVSPATTEPR